MSHTPHCAAYSLALHAPTHYVLVALPLRLASSRRLGATPCVQARSWARVHRVRLSLRCDVRVLACTLSTVGGHSSSCALWYTTSCGLECPRVVPATSLSMPHLPLCAPRACTPQLVHAAPGVDLGTSPLCGRTRPLGHSHRTSKTVFRHKVSTTHQGRLLALVPARGPDTLPYAKGIWAVKLLITSGRWLWFVLGPNSILPRCQNFSLIQHINMKGIERR